MNLVRGNHILGGFIGAVISAPLTAWIVWSIGNALDFKMDALNTPFPIQVACFSGGLALYVALAFLVSWVVGSFRD